MPQAAPVSHLQELDLAVDHEALDTQPAGKRAGDRKRPTSRTASPLRIPALLSGEHQRLGNAIAPANAYTVPRIAGLIGP